MKRALAVVLMLAMVLVFGLSGCGKKGAGALRILLDVDGETRYSRTAQAFEELLKEIEAQGGPAGVEVEYLPQSGVERKNAVTHLRAEIMAGAGPDLFMISSTEGRDGEFLFPFPEKSAINGLFMPLDRYIESAKFAMWDSFNETVMAVGRTERGRMLAPLSYTFPITCFPRLEASHSCSKELTWDHMLEDEGGILRASAALEAGSDKNMIRALDSPDFSAILGKTADYKAEELLFTEEELVEYTHKQLELDGCGPEEFSGLPLYFHTRAYPWFYGDGETQGHVRPYIPKGDPLTVVPRYNKDGGVTATVLHYACINARSRRGQDAFFVLDYILSRDAAFKDVENESSVIYGLSARQDFYSLFTGSDGLHIDGGISWESVYEGAISPENRASIDVAGRCVTAVNVYGRLQFEIDRMLEECRGLEGDIDEDIREVYRVIDMELKES